MFVGGCLGLGASSRVVGDCIQGLHTPLMGTTLMAEYEDVLGLKALFGKSRLSADEREGLLDISSWTAISSWTGQFVDSHQLGHQLG